MLRDVIGNGCDVIALVFLFGLTILVHELGHMLVALWCGMKVETFSIGFGPAIWRRKIRGIDFKVAWFPLGGYVALPQLDPSGMAALQGETEDVPLPPVSPWKKILVSLAGATGNIILAVVLAWIVFLAPDVVTEETGGAVVGYVADDSVAYAQGIRPGDVIEAVNGKPVTTWGEFGVECVLSASVSNQVRVTLRSGDEVTDLVLPTSEVSEGVSLVAGLEKALPCMITGVAPDGAAAAGGVLAGDIVRCVDGRPVINTPHFVELLQGRGDEEVVLTLERAGAGLDVTVVPRHDPTYDRVMIGVKVEGVMVTPWMQYKKPMAQISGDARGILRVLRALVTPRESKRASKALGGPVMIIMALWASIKISIINAIGFLRFLNVNLAILNLLPLPVLDGGHIVFSLWEGITRRRVNPKFVNVLVHIFMVLLLCVFVLLTRLDILRLFPSVGRLFGGPGVEEVQEAEQVAPGADPAGAGPAEPGALAEPADGEIP